LHSDRHRDDRRTITTVDWSALASRLVGALAAILGGLLLQLRSERRRMLGTSRIVVHEVRRNAAAVEWYFERTHAVPRSELVHVALQISTTGWDGHNTELAHLLSDELIDDIERVYAELRDVSPWSLKVNPDWRTRLREIERRLVAASHRTWFDHHVWRI
jgi:hypothetical protein